MESLRRLASALRNLQHKQQIESDLDMEIRSYVQALTDEKIASGISPAEGRRQALVETGGLEQVKQAVRDGQGSTAIQSVMQDVRYGLRQLWHNPAFSCTAVITLGLGIGATTAIFSAVYALLIRPLPYPGSDRLMEISEVNPKQNEYGGPMVSPDFVAAQSSLRNFESIAGSEAMGDMNLTGSGDPIRVRVAGITANFLSQLHVTPEVGRGFLSSEDRKGGPAVVLLSHGLWRSKFGEDPKVVGRSITLEGQSRTVVGVLPAGFIFPDSEVEPDLYVPTGFDSDTTITQNTQVHMVRVIGKLSTRAHLEEAQTELKLFAANRAKGYPVFLASFMEQRVFVAEPLHRFITGNNRKPLLILLACVGAVLLIACANVTNLQLARSVARQHEMALRGALGAGRLRLVRQSLIESLMLAAISAVLGIGTATLLTWLIRRGGMPGGSSSSLGFAEILQVPFGKLSAAVEMNGGVLAFTAGLVLMTTVLIGILPAISGSRWDLRAALQGGTRRISAGRGDRRVRKILLTTEIGLAVVLLTGAGLLIRSFVNVLHNDSGFDPRQCLTAELQRNYTEAPEKTVGFVGRLLQRLQGLPGVQTAAISSSLPLQSIAPNTAVLPGDGPIPPIGQWPVSYGISITPDYLRSAGIHLLSGRGFSESDDADSAPVVIVSKLFAEHNYNGSALGKQIRTNINSRGADQFTRRTIVGVVQDVRYNGAEANMEPVIYLPLKQVRQTSLTILLRSNIAPGSLSSAVRRAVIETDSDQPVFNLQTMEGRISQLVAQRRLIMLLIASFALLALLLAGVGVYGVFMYWVSQRRQEMGIRLALGSTRGGLLRLILIQAARLILVGGSLGLAAAWFLDRMLASALVGVRVHDPVSLTLAWALMTLFALAGTGLPALHASRTDIVSVLHSE